jgi:hypothetical protein
MPEEMIADYDVRSPASRTFLTVIGTLLTVALLVGLVLGASILMRGTRVTTSVVDLGDSAQLFVKATSADIRVVEGGQGVVKVTSRVTSGLRKTDFQLGRRGDEIKVVSGCQSWLSPGCGVALTLHVPKGLPVVIETTSGDVRADSISQGVLTVSSTSGDITGGALGVDEFSAQSSSGDISASFARQPFAFKADTEDGDVTATVPTGERTYAVTATSKSGDVSSRIDSDKEGAGFIRATSGSGDITLNTR